MNKKKYIVFTLVVIIICILPFAGMLFAKTEATSENKKLSEWPVLKDEEGINKEYMEEAGAYFLDHFAFKEKLAGANAIMQAKLFNVSSEDDVIIGNDGWLYYTATLDDFQHNNSVSERQLYSMAHNMKLMQEYVELFGKQFVFTIAPNKNSLYGKNMPANYKYKVSEKSDAERFIPYLESEGVNYVDLYSLFNEEDEVLYYKQDSHWTEKGAVLVYNELLDSVSVNHYRYDDVNPEVSYDYIGDLASMLYASSAEGEEKLTYIKENKYSYVAGEDVTDMLINTYNPSGCGSLLMYRDSFGNSLLPYFANAYENAQFSKIVPYPMTDVVTAAPDLVIVEKVERHLPTLSEVPPIMQAPVREIGDYSEGNICAEIAINDNGLYYDISGTINTDDMPVKSQIYIVIKCNDETKAYEAFLTGKSVDGEYTDQCFKAYISSLEKLPEDTIIEIVTDLGNGYEKIYEGAVY